MSNENESPRVLVVDDDADVADVVRAILEDEGYAVTVLSNGAHDVVARAVGSIEPDCILLDGSTGTEYGGSWGEAAYLADRDRSIPVVMFSAHRWAVREALEGTSERVIAAQFAAVVAKPFDLDELLEAVASATKRAIPFDRSSDGDTDRAAALTARLRDRGASEIGGSQRREWATFTAGLPASRWQLYWRQDLGAYVLGRYRAGSGILEARGHYAELEAALDAAFGERPT